MKKREKIHLKYERVLQYSETAVSVVKGRLMSYLITVGKFFCFVLFVFERAHGCRSP